VRHRTPAPAPTDDRHPSTGATGAEAITVGPSGRGFLPVSAIWTCARELTNHVLVITRWRVDDEDAVLNSYRHLRVTLLVTYSGIDDKRIEPVESSIAV
jgi:hypothetical protein